MHLRLIIICILLVGSIYGQKDSLGSLSNGLGMSVIPKFSLPTDLGVTEFVSSPGNTANDDFVINPQFTFQTALSYRIILSKRRNIFLSLDLGYLNNGCQVKNMNTWVHLIDSEGNISFDTPSLADISYNNHYGFVSVLLGKSFWNSSDNKFNLIGILGIQGQYLFSSSFYVKHQSETNRQFDYANVYKGVDITQSIVATAVAELGFDIRISSNFSFLATSVCLYDLNAAKLSNSFERNYYSLGLKLGVLYNITRIK